MGTLADAGVIAILRGVRPERVVRVADLCYRHGVRAIEIPLNSPTPLASIARLAGHALPGCAVGAGTVLDVDDVQRVRDAGASFVVAPNVNADVIRAVSNMGMDAVPGFATPTEACAAVDAGATLLKLFPASTYGPGHLKALRAVLPSAVRVFPVGGVGPRDCAAWLEAGAAGFGFGSELFRPDEDDAALEWRIVQLMRAYRAARNVPGDVVARHVTDHHVPGQPCAE